MNFLVRKILEDTWDKLVKEFILMALAAALTAMATSLGNIAVNKFFHDEHSENLKDQVIHHVNERLQEIDKEAQQEQELALYITTIVENYLQTRFQEEVYVGTEDEHDQGTAT